jgi:tetratricopeptide (TPR) repeat protein
MSQGRDVSATADTATDAGRGRADGTEPYPSDDPAAGSTSVLGIGATIGRYRIERILGSGATGVVLAAFDDELGRRVAIKFLVREYAEARGRLIREAKAMAQLSHPNVVTVYEVLRLSERTAIVMALVEGQTLAAWQAERARSWRELVDVYVQAARGLAAAHRAGLVHRDFKPTNALIDHDGVVRVTDFGLVRTAGDGGAASDSGGGGAGASPPSPDDLTRTGAVMGTPAFMAPEQHRGETVDARSDQWSFACALHGAVYGERPFAGESYASLSASVIAGELRPEPEATTVPARVRAAIRRGLSNRPADRFPSMDAMIEALVPRARRWPALAAGALAVGTVAAAIAFAPARGAAGGSCAELDAPIAAVWGPAQAGALRAKATALGDPALAGAADRAIAGLDQYRGAWIEGRTAACVEGRQGTASADRLDRRMSCLDDRLGEVRALVGVVTAPAADAQALHRARDAVQDLHPVADCVDPEATVPRPADPAVRAELARGEASWAQAWALAEVGKYVEGLPLAQQAVEIAERAGWDPLIAKAQIQLGHSLSHNNDGKAALAAFQRAATAAARGKSDDDLAQALISQVFTVAYTLGRPDDALAMQPYIELALDRAGQPPRIRGHWLHHLAVAYIVKERYDDALTAETAALAIFERLFPPDHVEVIDSVSALGNIQMWRGELALAKSYFERALAARQAMADPDVGGSYTNLGLVEARLGNMAAAMAHYERADELEAQNPMPSWVAPINLALARIDSGAWSKARDPADRAYAAAQRQAPGKSLPVAATAATRGVERLVHGDLAAANAAFDEALAAAADPGLQQDLRGVRVLAALAGGDVAAARAELAAGDAVDAGARRSAALALGRAALAQRTGDCKPAVAAYEVAAAAAEASGELYMITEATFGIADCEVTQGAAAAAVRRAEARVAWLESQHAEPGALARGRWTLARALITADADRARALALAEAARAGYVTLGAPGKARAAEIERWIAARK